MRDKNFKFHFSCQAGSCTHIALSIGLRATILQRQKLDHL